MRALSTLLVDKSADFLTSAERFLGQDPRLHVIGRAMSGREALEQAKRLKPDLVFMHVAIGVLNGLDATRRLKESTDAPLIILTTSHDSEEYRQAGVEAGADAYVIKSEFAAQVPKLIDHLFSRWKPADAVESLDKNRRAETDLRTQLLAKMPAGAYTCDADGLITFFNERAVEIWGREPRLNDPADRY